MAKDVTEQMDVESSFSNKPQYLNTHQLEYSVKQFFVYGGLAAVAITLGVTYIYLLIQKIKN